MKRRQFFIVLYPTAYPSFLLLNPQAQIHEEDFIKIIQRVRIQWPSSQMFSEVGGGVVKKLKPDALMKSILRKEH